MGYRTLILYFSRNVAGIASKVEQTCLTAKTLDGERIHGCGKIEYGQEGSLSEALAFSWMV